MDTDKEKEKYIRELKESMERVPKLNELDSLHGELEKRVFPKEDIYRLLVEEMGEGLAFVELEGTITYANSSFSEILGVSHEEIVGRDLKEFISPKSFKIIKEQSAKHNSGEKSTHELEIIHRDGKKCQVFFSSAPYFDEDGQYKGAFTFPKDVTNQRIMEEKLRESEQRFREIAESSVDIIYSLNKQGLVTYVSPAVERILGYEPLEITGKPIWNYITESELPKASKAFNRVTKGKNLEGLELNVLRKDKSKVFVDVSSSPLIRDGEIIGTRNPKGYHKAQECRGGTTSEDS